MMNVSILVGDVIDKLKEIPDDHFDCIVTSPPYWGLRDYDVVGQIGLEPTLGEHLSIMVEVGRHLRRVLKPTGTFWLNYGDCYATSPNGRSAAATKAAGNDDRTFRDKPFSTIGGALKAKDLCMVPNRLAIALQEDGWFVRSEIIWGKPNPMPESIKDRPATAHEKIFMMTKSSRYFYDQNAVRQGRTSDEDANTFRGGSYVGGEPGPRKVRGNKRINSTRQDEIASSSPGSSSRRMVGFNDRWNEKVRASAVASPRHIGQINHTGTEDVPRGEGRNLRNYEPAPVDVWNIAPAAFSDAHFATFPPELAYRCLSAGCPPNGNVLDPFGGAGTTALVARRLGHDCTLIEISSKYAEMTRRRLMDDIGVLGPGEVSVA